MLGGDHAKVCVVELTVYGAEGALEGHLVLSARRPLTVVGRLVLESVPGGGGGRRRQQHQQQQHFFARNTGGTCTRRHEHSTRALLALGSLGGSRLTEESGGCSGTGSALRSYTPVRRGARTCALIAPLFTRCICVLSGAPPARPLSLCVSVSRAPVNNSSLAKFALFTHILCMYVYAGVRSTVFSLVRPAEF